MKPVTVEEFCSDGSFTVEFSTAPEMWYTAHPGIPWGRVMSVLAAARRGGIAARVRRNTDGAYLDSWMWQGGYVLFAEQQP